MNKSTSKSKKTSAKAVAAKVAPAKEKVAKTVKVVKAPKADKYAPMLKKDLVVAMKAMDTENKKLANQVNQLKSSTRVSDLEKTVGSLVHEKHKLQLDLDKASEQHLRTLGDLSDLRRRYLKLELALTNIKNHIEKNQPYYFIQFRKNWMSAKYILNEIKSLLSYDTVDE